jgi:hypothetical protein
MTMDGFNPKREAQAERDEEAQKARRDEVATLARKWVQEYYLHHFEGISVSFEEVIEHLDKVVK